jgi:hypothetical protein
MRLVRLAGLLLLFSLVPANAQIAGGSITGTITAQSGNALPGVSVTVKDTATAAVRVVVSDKDGLYHAPDLPAGTYEFTAKLPGFVTQLWSPLTITVGTERVLNIVMQPGNSQKVVRLEPPVPLGNQASACCAGSINSAEVRNTPLNGRDWAQMATLQAGVTGVQNGSATGGGNADRGFGSAISISGARPDQNSYRLDGISINDYSNGAPGSVLGDNLGVDAVEQVSVLGSNYPAEYGLTSGGVINAVTRSGTNDFHGDVYEFLRNSALDARNYFDGPIPPFKRNQFGGSAGLPIQKGRTFLFGDYEGLRQSLGVTTVDTVPSAAARSGQLSTGAVPVDLAVARFLAAFYPLPNGPLLGAGDTGIFSFPGQQVTNENYFTFRADRKLSAKDVLYGTYMRDSSKTVQPDAFDNVLSNIVSSRQVVTVHEQHIVRPNLLNSARFGFSRAVGIIGGVSKVLNPLVLDPSYAFIPGDRAGEIHSVPGVTDFLGAPTVQGPLPTSRSLFWNSFQVGDDVFLTHGIHAIKFGAMVDRMQSNEASFSNSNGVFRFDSLSLFLTNQPHVFQGTITHPIPTVGLRQTLFGAYAQDDIRLSQNVTINLGLRYEMVAVPTEAHGRISVLRNLTDAQPHLGAPLFQNPTLRNFEPRLGMAWNPGAGKTLIRSGFGIFDVLPLPYEFNLSFQRAVPFVDAVVLDTLPAGAFPTGADQIAGSASGIAYYAQQNPKRNYVMQWNVSVAEELSSSMAFTLGYVGSRGIHQPYRVDNIDMVLPTLTSAGYVFPPTATSQPLNPNFGRINANLWLADSYYDALQIDFAKRASHGFDFHAAYTWGKSIDTLSATEADDAFPNGLFNQLFFDPHNSRGLSDFNVAQTLVASFNWEIPGPESKWKAVRWAASGWQLGGLYKASTGQPFTAILGGDPVGQKVDETSEPPNRIAGSACRTLTNTGNPNHYIKTQCLAFPNPSNLWGNLGRNTLIGPGQSKLDASIFKNNRMQRISETFNAQFRAEFFNILNHTNFSSPTSNNVVFDQNGAPVPSAGLITSTQTTSRQIQFALKLIW